MSTSQNGWPAADYGDVGKHFVAGTGTYFVIRKGDAATVLIDFLNWFHTNIESISGGVWDDWGFAKRNIVGSSTTLSNHASGTAVDVNATKHPLGRRGTFTSAQTEAIRSRLKFYEGAIRWGGDYEGRADEMHFEINRNEQFVARIAQKIKNANKVVVEPTTPTQPPVLVKPSPKPPARNYLKKGDKSAAVGALQKRLKALGFYTGLIDNNFGPKTEAAEKAFQVAAGLKDDGVHGKNSEARMKLVPAFPGYSRQYPKGKPRYLRATYLMQKRLQQRGWNIRPDGYHYTKTTGIFKRFQSSKKIGVDGIGGPQFWTALYAQPVT